jgi:hypothetical protein
MVNAKFSQSRPLAILDYIAQLPEPLSARFSGLLMEGGRIADHVLRMTAELNK